MTAKSNPYRFGNITLSEVVSYQSLTPAPITLINDAFSETLTLGGQGDHAFFFPDSNKTPTNVYGKLYSLSLAKDELIELTFGNAAVAIDTVLSIFSSLDGSFGENRLIRWDEDNYGENNDGERHFFSAPEAGTYYILATGQDGDDIGEVLFTVTKPLDTIVAPGTDEDIYVMALDGESYYRCSSTALTATDEPIAEGWTKYGMLSSAGALDCDLFVLINSMNVNIGSLNLGTGKLKAALASDDKYISLSGSELILGGTEGLDDVDIDCSLNLRIKDDATLGSLVAFNSGSVTIDSGATLAVQDYIGMGDSAALTNNGTLTVQDDIEIYNNAALANNGTLTAQGYIDMYDNTALTNRGTLTAQSIYVDGSAALTNYGYLTTKYYFCMFENASLKNNGALDLSDGAMLAIFSEEAENSGTILAYYTLLGMPDEDHPAIGTLTNRAGGVITTPNLAITTDGSALRNAGELNLTDTAQLVAAKAIINTGTVTNTGIVATDKIDAVSNQSGGVLKGGAATGNTGGLYWVGDDDATDDDLAVLLQLGTRMLNSIDTDFDLSSLNESVSGENYAWNHTDKILTLNNIIIEGNVILPAEATIKISGFSTIAGNIKAPEGSPLNVTLQGPARLIVVGDILSTAEGSALTLTDNANVTVAGTLNLFDESITGRELTVSDDADLTVSDGSILNVMNAVTAQQINVTDSSALYASVEGREIMALGMARASDTNPFALDMANINDTNPSALDMEGGDSIKLVGTNALLALDDDSTVSLKGTNSALTLDSSTKANADAIAAALEGFLPDGVTLKWNEGENSYLYYNVGEADEDVAKSVLLTKNRTCTVRFFPTNGDALTSRTVAAGKTASAPRVSYSGYKLDGWYTAAGDKFDFSTAIDSDLNLFAHWSEKTGGTTSSGGGGGSAVTSYTITATAGTGGTITPSGKVSVSKDKSQTFAVAAQAGYEIQDVLVDNESVGAVSSYTFDKVQKAHTIEAKFKETTNVWNNPFGDVKTNDWFYEAVSYACQNNLFAGVSGNLFAPDDSMSRAMLVTVLYRMAGEPESAGMVLSEFSDSGDIPSWALDAMRWAIHEEILTGKGEGILDPNGIVTREQMSAILYRYAQLKGYDVSVGADTNILACQSLCPCRRPTA